MQRRYAMLLGLALGATFGWAFASREVRRHRTALFSSRPLRRMAALANLRRQPGVETVRLLRDYLEWERHPALRRRAAAVVRRMEAALG